MDYHEDFYEFITHVKNKDLRELLMWMYWLGEEDDVYSGD